MLRYSKLCYAVIVTFMSSIIINGIENIVIYEDYCSIIYIYAHVFCEEIELDSYSATQRGFLVLFIVGLILCRC
jgi:hypothetical protein